MVLKVWCDVVDDGLGDTPFDPEQILRPRNENEFRPEATGYLSTPVDIDGWVRTARARYAFLRDMDDLECRIAVCNRGDDHEVRQRCAGLTSPAAREGD